MSSSISGAESWPSPAGVSGRLSVYGNGPYENVASFPALQCLIGCCKYGEPGTRQMTDDISLLLGKMGIGHGRLLLGVRLIVLPKLPETLSCPPVILSGAL